MIDPDFREQIDADVFRRFGPDHDLTITPKSWGYEAQIINGADYCGKILVFFMGRAGSLHFHRVKHETWLVLEGTGTVTTHDPATGAPTIWPLTRGKVFDLPPAHAHRVRATPSFDLVLLEVSTPDDPADTYRLSASGAAGAAQ